MSAHFMGEDIIRETKTGMWLYLEFSFGVVRVVFRERSVLAIQGDNSVVVDGVGDVGRVRLTRVLHLQRWTHYSSMFKVHFT